MMKAYGLLAAEAWPPYLILGILAVYVLVKALRFRRRKREIPPPEVMDTDLIEWLNEGRSPHER
ncbi:hypothetical protein [Gorillibacterium timonense]|uniref:hypothetical protein n=1 Tax=Gorillibacterium timonense TaxID=1689269 RepID=UPI00071E2227|nr:hypothetical protein [Gorillibacterium timonense]